MTRGLSYGVFEPLETAEVSVRTMRDNPATGFQFVGRKRVHAGEQATKQD